MSMDSARWSCTVLAYSIREVMFCSQSLAISVNLFMKEVVSYLKFFTCWFRFFKDLSFLSEALKARTTMRFNRKLAPISI